MNGTNRRNVRNNREKKPSVPARMLMSTQVGEYDLHIDGMYSRCKLCTMITKRSHHIPTLIRIEITNSARTLRRNLRSHSSCGTSTLHAIIVQNTALFGPNGRPTKNW